MDQNIITICTFRMFENILFKTVQFANDIVHAVNYVLFNMLILSQWRNVASFVHSLQEESKEEKEKQKRSVYSYLLQRTKKKISHSFFLILDRKAV